MLLTAPGRFRGIVVINFHKEVQETEPYDRNAYNIDELLHSSLPLLLGEERKGILCVCLLFVFFQMQQPVSVSVITGIYRLAMRGKIMTTV